MSAWAVSMEDVMRVAMLRDYNTRVVVLGTAALGVAAGVCGTLMLLRKKALLGDAISHAMLPGIGIAYMVMVMQGGSGKNLPALLAGAMVFGMLGAGTALGIQRWTRLKADAAMGIVLSVFFGAGVAVMGIAQRMGSGNAAGLETFIYGKTASMLASDGWLILGIGGVIVGAAALLFKEFRLVSFDAGYARSDGWPTGLLDFLLMMLVTGVTVIGLQAVGLILVVALEILPAASARFWTEKMGRMAVIAGVLGGVSGAAGSAASALVPRLPSGAMIVLTASVVFAASMAAGPSRGVARRLWERRGVKRKTARQHLLRAMYEEEEMSDPGGGVEGVEVGALMRKRSWGEGEVRRSIARAKREGLVRVEVGARVRLTERGREEARRLTRNHRLWELYLVNHADVAVSHVDRDADMVEHVLGEELTQKLEGMLASSGRMPASLHPVAAVQEGGVG